MANNKKTPKNKPLFGGFDRLQDFPLDSSSVYETWSDLQAYLHSSIAYDGQLIVCLEPEHYGAYIVKDKTFKQDDSVGEKITLAYKLYGSEEFAREVETIWTELNGLNDRLTHLSEEDLAQVKATLAKAESWIKRANENGQLEGDPIFATKTQLAALKEELDKNVTKIYTEIYGEAFADQIRTIEEYGETINSIYDFIQDHNRDFNSIIQGHENRLTTAESRLGSHDTELFHYGVRIFALENAVDTINRKLLEIDEHEERISQAEQDISDIKTSLESIERFEEYDFGDRSEIGGVEYKPGMVIKEIEIVISNTGDINNDTSLEIDFPATSNAQNAADIIVKKDEIFLIEDLKIILDVDYEVKYNGHIRFHARYTDGLRGHAYVRYYQRAEQPAVEPVEEPVEEPVAATQYTVTMDPIEHLSFEGLGSYYEGDNVIIRATPAEGYTIEPVENAVVLVSGTEYPVELIDGLYGITFLMLKINIKISFEDVFDITTTSNKEEPEGGE